MIEVHFYKETELKYSVYANNIEDVIEGPASYYTEYTTNMLISAVKYINPVLDNGNLREATKEELVAKGIEVQLEPGEIIQDKKLVKIPQPSKYHTWNGTEWSCNLEQAKEAIREKFKTMLYEKRYANFEYEGNTYQMGITDIPHFEKIKMALDILEKYTDIQEILNLLENLDMDLVGMLKEYIKTNSSITKNEILAMLQNYETKWRLVDNSMVTITYRKVLEILVAWIFRDGYLNNIYNNINLKIAEATCVEELKKIKWE